MRSKAFTLIEILIGMALSLIVIAGVAAAFNVINSGARNAARSSDLTNNIRGVFQILQNDLYKASQGVGDLNPLQIHFNNPTLTSEELFFGISSLDDDSGNSEFVIQYFDYDMLAGGDDTNPTFVVDWPGSTGPELWPPAIPNLILMSSLPNDPGLANLQPGDILLIYCVNAVYNVSVDQYINSLGATAFTDESHFTDGGIGNGAMLVQVADREETNPDPQFVCYESAVRVALGGPVFVNDFGGNVRTPYTEPDPFYSCPLNFLQSDDGSKKGRIRPAGDTWLARKLGRQAAYHRVTYRLDANTLIREENGVDMILASNVTAFDLEVGLDVVPGSGDRWDGSVSVADPASWFSDMDDIDPDRDSARAYMGRHTVSVRASVSFESLMTDTSDTGAGGTGGTKIRSMANQFRIKNQHLPIGNL
ncbi:MAG: prepilin-type N-terminal cleavage/methylation domain-containing protein [Acidobacteria bacterium]|nr:prepilin-type N-terminal cleavage/methylation domain-containing protein [Acidobacteriota bacterium]